MIRRRRIATFVRTTRSAAPGTPRYRRTPPAAPPGTLRRPPHRPAAAPQIPKGDRTNASGPHRKAVISAAPGRGGPSKNFLHFKLVGESCGKAFERCYRREGSCGVRISGLPQFLAIGQKVALDRQGHARMAGHGHTN